MKFFMVLALASSLSACGLVAKKNTEYLSETISEPMNGDDNGRSIVIGEMSGDTDQEAMGVESDESEKDLSMDLPLAAGIALREMIDSTGRMIDAGVMPESVADRQRYKKVKFWLNYFTKRAGFQRYLDRGQTYKEVVQTILAENEVPKDLYYLAMIESGYVPHAYSRARAVGVWQFIRPTGRHYGLKSNYYVDERRDPILATEGAVKYLTDLYNAFQSWELAMAAYNCGELRVFRAIIKYKTRDFWEITARRRLPKETRNYVPKFIAAALIGLNPEKYGLEDPAGKEYEPYPDLEAVEVPAPVSLKLIAEKTGVDYHLLKKVNPHILRGVTPPGQSEYEIWVPVEHARNVALAKSTLLNHKVSLKKIAKSGNHHTHIVRKGENLSVIANRYRMSVRTLKRINGLGSNRIYPGKKLRVSTKSYRRMAKSSKRGRMKAGVGGRYKVRSGDTMEAIARDNGISVNQLKRFNGKSSSRIYAGEVLSVKPGI